MREIKFRAWNNRYSKIIYDVFPTRVKLHTGYLNYMQYTGLKDKNGVEIYEGDIVRYHQAEYNEATELYEDRITCVEWADDCYGLIHRDTEMKLTTPFNILRTKVIEVIGNIYENPELVK